jgi:hypothetical protein
VSSYYNPEQNKGREGAAHRSSRPNPQLRPLPAQSSAEDEDYEEETAAAEEWEEGYNSAPAAPAASSPPKSSPPSAQTRPATTPLRFPASPTYSGNAAAGTAPGADGLDNKRPLTLEQALALVQEQESDWVYKAGTRLKRLAGGSLGFSIKAANWLFSEGQLPDSREVEYMSNLKKNMYRFGGTLIAAWSAFLTQAVAPKIFPFLEVAGQTTDNIFEKGLTISLKALLASIVFTFILSALETMFFDHHKTRAKKLLVGSAFGLDWVINTLGWVFLFNHLTRFEWLAFAPLLRGGPVEWGSLVCQFLGAATAILPEMMWDKARRAARLPSPAFWGNPYGPGQNSLAGMNTTTNPSGERGVWVKDELGQLSFMSLHQLKLAAKARAKNVKGK